MTNAAGILFILILWPLVWSRIFPTDTGTLSWGLAFSTGLLGAAWAHIANAIDRKLEKPHETKSDSMAYGWNWLVQPIRTEQRAVAALDELAKGWYALASLQAIGMAQERKPCQPVNTVSDLVLQALGGYLLPRIRSRVLAIVLLLYGIGNVAAAYLGFMGARNVIRTVFQLLVGFRGAQATMVYHSKAETVTVWKNVAIIGAMLLAAAFIVILGGLVARDVAEALFALKISGDIVGAVVYMALLAVHLKTRRRFPCVVRPSVPA